MALRSEGELLLVDEGDRLPKVCLKCGATDGVTRDLVRRRERRAARAAAAKATG